MQREVTSDGMVQTRRVALLVETSRGYGRELLSGIVRYSRLHGPWSFYITPGDFKQALPKMKAWGGTGIIARIETRAIAEAICELKLPTIGLDIPAELYPMMMDSGCVSEVHPDPSAAAEMAIEHLLERSFRQFAFVGFDDRVWSQQRRKAFVGQLERQGLECRVYEQPRRRGDLEWAREQVILSDWLKSLPKPCGIFCCNDDRGRQVLEAAKAAELKVPDEIAVVGMDNDDLLCELCDPPLSSVALNAARGGFEAAQLLDDLMSGRASGTRQIVVEPLWVARRLSTDVLAVNDPQVSAALQFIRDHANEPIQVETVLGAQKISRRSLEMRFRNAIGRSIHDEIQRARLERVKHLLAETDWSNERIAATTGFASGSYMGQAMKRVFGVTPTQYRAQIRAT